MECNKDDALRAKEIAEKKFLAKDFSGAKKFALKAHNLNPGLECIDQMLATLDVYIAAESKVNGEGNFYGILGVSPKADAEAIRKQYRKLALVLHPDKNKSLGAEGAFKHVSEAWSLLSDKNKKSAYDVRNESALQLRVQATNADSSQQSKQNGFYNFAKNAAASRAKPPKGSNANKKSSSGKQDRGTFWTVCYRCKMQYEYMRMYLNHNLLCPNCHEAFFAVESTPPSNASKKSAQSNYSQQQQNTHNGGMKKVAPTTGRNSPSTPNMGSSNDFQWSPFSKTSGHASTVQAANVVQQAYQKVRRERQEAQAAKREEALRRKNHSSRRPSAGQSNATKRKRDIFDLRTSRVKHNCQSSGASAASPVEAEQGSSERVKFTNKLSNEKEGSHNDVKHLLMEKAKKEILKKLGDRVSATDTTSLSSTEVIITREAKDRQIEENRGSDIDVREDHDAAREQVTTETKTSANRATPETFDNYSDNDPVECMSIDVPNSDFYNFDSDRIESCFGPNQVWAAYDDSDGMPRYYAMILKVKSLNPFKAKISWLNSNNNSETSSHCVNSSVPRTCGYFRRSRHEIRTSVNCFSHQVDWKKGPGDTIQVFPRKGEIWALYSNFSSEWEEHTEDGFIQKFDLIEDGFIQKYDLIEVLEDYNEEGVVVTPLVKVAGFKSVFHKHLNPREVRNIPSEEMFRFSHQISSNLLTGKEGPNAPKGCQELDPAAMPVELLEVIQDVEEAECINHQGVKEANTIDGTGTSTTNSREETSSTMEVKEIIIIDSSREETSSTMEVKEVIIIDDILG